MSNKFLLISLILYMVLQKEFCNDIPNVTVWRVLRKRLHLKAYKLPIVQGVHSNYWNSIVKLFFKLHALPVEATLNRSYPR
jgi:hypothetical protein